MSCRVPTAASAVNRRVYRVCGQAETRGAGLLQFQTQFKEESNGGN